MTIITNLLKLVLIVVLPFVILVRGSVYIHQYHELGAYPSLLVGLAGSTILLFVYMTIVYAKLTSSLGDGDNLQRRLLFAFLLVLGYSLYGLYFMSPDNFKKPELRKEMNDLHPILRLGVSTFILLDRDMIITDATRVPEDYRSMGLTTPRGSLHYTQQDGYAYAMDLRTSDRHELRNTFMTMYFRLLGFRTLRHTGTADHLHVSLHCHYRPRAR